MDELRQNRVTAEIAFATEKPAGALLFLPGCVNRGYAKTLKYRTQRPLVNYGKSEGERTEKI